MEVHLDQVDAGGRAFDHDFTGGGDGCDHERKSGDVHFDEWERERGDLFPDG